MPQHGAEHERAGRRDPDVGAAAATGDLSRCCCGEAGGKAPEEFGVSRGG